MHHFALLLVAVNAEVLQIDSWTAKEDTWTSTTRHVAHLNGLLFHGTARAAMGGGAEQWIVAFCASWWEPCDELDVIFDQLAAEWQGQLNTQDFLAKVRFATVDCATDKVLCNEEHVDLYPTISYYKEGRQIRQLQLHPKRMKDRLRNWSQEILGTSKSELIRSTPGAPIDYTMDMILLVLALCLLLKLLLVSDTKDLASDLKH